MATGVLAPLVTGLLLTALTYGGSYISGAHYNPAVSLAFLLQGKLNRDDFPGYVFGQLLGAVLAAIMGGFLLSFTTHPDIALRTNHVLGALTAEFLGTFALVYVFFHVMLPERRAGNPYYAAAIGFMVIGLYAIFGEVSGAVCNPAVAVGAAISGSIAWSDVWF